MAISVKTALKKALFLGLLTVFLLGCRLHGGFESHLWEAIEIYEARSHQYSQMTHGESDTLFARLLVMERASILMARMIDHKAKPFNQQGIRVVQGDFVSMQLDRAPEDLITPSAPLGEDAVDLSRSLMKLLRGHQNSTHFEALVWDVENALLIIDAFETENNVHLPMLKHLIESIGFAALHAIEYACETENKTVPVSKLLIGFQIMVLNDAVIYFDRQANRFHQEGIGVLVNDLPPIPFLNELALLMENAENGGNELGC